MNEAPAVAVQQCLLAAIRAADPRPLVREALTEWHSAGAPDRAKRVVAVRPAQVIAVGKAAAAMLRGARDALGHAFGGGVLLAPDPAEPPLAGFAAFRGGHPLPDADGVRGAAEIARTIGALAADDRLLVLLSGGASALMTLPAEGIALDDLVRTTSLLLSAGADIRELNAVRKHLDRLKGGLMARACAGVHVRVLVLSDVIGDALDVIGSGPLVPDPTTFHDAITVLRSHDVWPRVPTGIAARLEAGARGEIPETPKSGDPCFARVTVDVIGNNALAVRGAAAEARRLGCHVELLDTPVAGEAREAGAAFARRVLEARRRMAPGRHLCLVGGGETTVTVTGRGVGGRNLELATAAALVIDGTRGLAIGSIGTDGRDGPTDAAGAAVDGTTAGRIRAAGLHAALCLANNDSLRALDAAAAVIRTGPTGTNVMDVQVGVAEGTG